jgi:hypothetical protein
VTEATTTATTTITPPAIDPSKFASIEEFNALKTESESLKQKVARSDALAMLERKITAAAALPTNVLGTLREKFTGMDRVFTEAEVDAEFTSTRKLLDIFTAQAPTAGRVKITASEYDRTVDALTEGVFGVKTERNAGGDITGFKGAGVMSARAGRDSSVKRWYVQLTGDDSMTGQVPQRLTESVSSSTFSNVMGDSITRAMVSEYSLSGLDTWRPFVSVVPARDFRTQRRERFGGYGNLPTVAQGGTYNALTSPTDEEVTYAIAKKGGTEDLTIEAIANDDLGAVRRIPVKLARSYAQTLHEFIYDFMRTNGNAYDGTALAATTRTTSNKGTTAFSATSLIAAKTRMSKHQDMSSLKRIGLRPRYLVIPLDLEQAAFEVLNTEKKPATAENDVNFVRSFGLSYITVPYWTDTNDWWLIADPAMTPVFELAFFNGQEEPELFLQDQPTVGNVFNADKLTWKIRGIFGGAPLDFRAYDGNIVP